ncbi:ISP domain-containing protein [Gonapodya prolifera JEL478]|uniref:Choline monooxygenase, chloroplastic n=1 Tax=Gonapodya prolifera (strain JEL478) TaxID=1344416 RepID=A0A139ASQ0_GONPJ|nr:ISP domain-containing protein [Gonapodya prolifera JEL478]|eukprot:KXS19573.1 ISP domain-containing protein [Gonapodya prolifera JEL478]
MASTAAESKPAPTEVESKKASRTQTLPASWFTNQEVFELERRGLFTKTWLYVCHNAYFKKAGDYKLFTVATFPIFLVMGKDNQIRAFHNVCRHRAYPVVKKESGSTTVLGCRYHGWSYDTLGNLVKAPSFDDVPGFKKEENGLYPIHVHVASGGFIFVNMEAKEKPSVSFSEHFGEMEKELEKIDFTKFEFRETFTMQGKFNWKTLMDGYQECYHCPVAHPGLARDFNINTYVVTPKSHYCIHTCQRKDAADLKKSADAEFTGSADGLWMYVYPNVGINVYSTSWYSIRVNPLSAGETLLEYEVFVAKDAPEQEKADFVKFLKQLEQEDFDLCVLTQANLEKGIYHEGVLHDFRERGVLYYQGEVRRMLEEHAALEKKAGRKILSASWAPAEADDIICGGSCEPSELKW